MSDERKMVVKFIKNRETKGTVLYTEVGDPQFHKVGSLYVKKNTLNQMTLSSGFPRAVQITLEVVDNGSAS